MAAAFGVVKRIRHSCLPISFSLPLCPLFLVRCHFTSAQSGSARFLALPLGQFVIFCYVKLNVCLMGAQIDVVGFKTLALSKKAGPFGVVPQEEGATQVGAKATFAETFQCLAL